MASTSYRRAQMLAQRPQIHCSGTILFPMTGFSARRKTSALLALRAIDGRKFSEDNHAPVPHPTEPSAYQMWSSRMGGESRVPEPKQEKTAGEYGLRLDDWHQAKYNTDPGKAADKPIEEHDLEALVLEKETSNDFAKAMESALNSTLNHSINDISDTEKAREIYKVGLDTEREMAARMARRQDVLDNRNSGRVQRTEDKVDNNGIDMTSQEKAVLLDKYKGPVDSRPCESTMFKMGYILRLKRPTVETLVERLRLIIGLNDRIDTIEENPD
ncbi:MAG: hypothetical protein M1812_007096 [Candelaria pacifica]|nr:MAG: hypothetical protein M1812_007096 [Candelaria pacifica]